MQSKIKTALAAAALFACAMAHPALADCEFKKLGEMTIDMSRGVPRIQVEANGIKRWVVLQTDASRTALRKADVQALGGGAALESNHVALSAKGEQRLDYSTIKNITLGGAFVAPALDVLVLENGNPNAENAGYIGADILEAAEVEFDLAHNRIALFTAKGCEKQSLAYWDGPIDETPMVSIVNTTKRISIGENGHVSFRPRATLNGQPLIVQLNSTLPYSQVDSGAAANLGVKQGSPDTTPAVGADGKPILLGRFADFSIGSEHIKNPTLVVRPLLEGANLVQTGSNMRVQLDGRPTMYLGLHFLRSHRVLVSRTQEKMYFSYNGGPVFHTPPMAQTSR